MLVICLCVCILISQVLRQFVSWNNLQEVTRIKNEHPDDSNCIVNDRVKGRLKVTRAFGAGFLKKVCHLLFFLHTRLQSQRSADAGSTCTFTFSGPCFILKVMAPEDLLLVYFHLVPLHNWYARYTGLYVFFLIWLSLSMDIWKMGWTTTVCLSNYCLFLPIVTLNMQVRQTYTNLGGIML